MFDVFPDNPQNPAADGVRNLHASLERARETGQPDTMAVQRHDIAVASPSGPRFEVRYWSPINTPVLDRDGKTPALIHRVEDVTELIDRAEQRRHTLHAGDTTVRACSANLAAELHRAEPAPARRSWP